MLNEAYFERKSIDDQIKKIKKLVAIKMEETGTVSTTHKNVFVKYGLNKSIVVKPEFREKFANCEYFEGCDILEWNVTTPLLFGRTGTSSSKCKPCTKYGINPMQWKKD